MKAIAHYIVDEKGKAKGVILGIRAYKKILQALEEAEDRRAIKAVSKGKSVPYSLIESRLKKDGLL